MKDCVFCRIAAKQIPAEFIYNDGGIMAIRDTNPLAPVHILVIPTEHIPYLHDFPKDKSDLLARLVRKAADIADQEDTQGHGYRIVTNGGSQAEIDHLHFHVLGGVADLDQHIIKATQ